MFDFRDRVAFVTGGASGIGLGIARALLAEGVAVAIADLQREHLDDAAAALGDESGKAVFLELDVTDRDAMTEAADRVERELGRVDILVNNAGVGVQGPLKKATFADWDFGIGVNLGGVINGLQIFVPRMREGGRGGHVVNTSSLGGIVQGQSFGAIYATSKAAIIALTESVRDSLEEDGIGASVLCPGPVKSRIHAQRDKRPDKFAANDAFTAAAQSRGSPPGSELWMDGDEVGTIVIEGIKRNDLYIITHGEFRPMAEARFNAILDAMPRNTNPDLLNALGIAENG
ncbi:SDR family NAD(P)-dependent oxidoreductase [Sphingopyxis granuli]|uniref:SDR family NAD(P)-dependent oxidoreductase n=1 Tax=Sphingopyxis granuli TaxID=267128 RepID=UPI00301C62F1